MPTIILLDVSLSMTRPVELADGAETTRKQLALAGIKSFLDHLSTHSRLEFVSLMSFSSSFQENCPFTRDYELIKRELANIPDSDKTCIEAALRGVSETILSEWGNNTPCQILLVTDGSTGIGFKDSLSRNPNFPLPFVFPAKLHILCIAPPEEPSLIKSKPLYQKLVDLNRQGSVTVTDSLLSEKAVCEHFQKVSEEMFACFKLTLKCGKLESRVILSPPPLVHTKTTEFGTQVLQISEMEVCGFIAVTDVGSPMAISRHLILPCTSTNEAPLSNQIDLTEEENLDEGKIPSFCVLLHGALKIENMAALVSLGENWFGFIYAWADTKKKSNLLLTVLPQGNDVVPWLGDLNKLGCADMALPEQVGSFPIKPNEKRSYSQNCVVWIRSSGLQSDIQKILRHARKLPEKTQQFYKEINRLRKAAISLGFFDLLNGLAHVFEQELLSLPGSAHPDCSLQLQHAADALRKPQNRDIKFVVTPLQTNFCS